MGRKKKYIQEEVEDKQPEEQTRTSFLHTDAKRSIIAVALFAAAILFVLGFFGSAGIVGEALNRWIGLAFGWGKWVFPFVLTVAGVFLLQRKQSSLAEFLKITGLTVAFVTLLGFFHLYGGDMSRMAAAGEGGGYLGFGVAFVLQKFTGMIAGTVILIALFLSGMILAFNLSLIRFFENLNRRMHRTVNVNVVESEGDESQEDGEVEYASLEKKEEDDETVSTLLADPEIVAQKENQPLTVDEHQLLEAENIRNVSFDDDPEPLVKDNSKKDDYDEVQTELARKKKKKKSEKPHWILPPFELLDDAVSVPAGTKNEHNAYIIQRTLKQFHIDVELGEIQTGPTVTRYTFRPTAGIKLSRITALSNDLALALAAKSIRIEAPIPGKSLVGIEVPNKSSAMVRLKNILSEQVFVKRDGNLTLVLGQDVMGEFVLGDLRSMPHMLVAGATNSGKSVCINTLLLSLLYQNSPDDLKLILVDPKRVELSLYNTIPHLLTDVIVDNKKVINVLRWSVSEMERRYKVLQESGSRDLASYNQKIEGGEKRFTVDAETNESCEEDWEKLPYIVIVIDEMADLMMAHGKDVESLIVRLAQMSRAVGIHLILATQRPSVEVLTGLIKANITTRIAFQVATQIDSRTILDQGGAEKLLGRGDMLYVSAGASQPRRLQGVFISEEEVKKVVAFLKQQKKVHGNEEDIPDAFTDSKTNTNAFTSSFHQQLTIDSEDPNDSSGEDSLYHEAKETVIRAGKASATLLQRRLRVGYSRAARILDLHENDGIIGPSDGAKPREVYTSTSSENTENPPVEDNPLSDQAQRDRWQV